MSFRIAFSGSSGTGKTTTGCLLATCDKLKTIDIINPDARALLSELGHKNIQDVTGRDYVEFQKAYLQKLLKCEEDRSCFITERSSIDCLAFWNCFCAAAATTDESEEYAQVCISNARTYSQIFYFPLGVIPYINDGWRGGRQSYFVDVDIETRRIYEETGIKYYEVCKIDLHERREEILSRIGLR